MYKYAHTFIHVAHESAVLAAHVFEYGAWQPFCEPTGILCIRRRSHVVTLALSAVGCQAVLLLRLSQQQRELDCWKSQVGRPSMGHPQVVMSRRPSAQAITALGL